MRNAHKKLVEEKAANENFNGRLRSFLPKHPKSYLVTPNKVKNIMEKMNRVDV